ncbi:MAG: hypothetical protein AAFY17_17115, partial [Cyanobacteria bacterium J06642_11]
VNPESFDYAVNSFEHKEMRTGKIFSVKLKEDGRATIQIPVETYDRLKLFHKTHGSAQFWATAEEVIEAGLNSIDQQNLSEAA